MLNSLDNRNVCKSILFQYCNVLEIKDTPRLIFYKKDILELPYSDRKGGANTKKLCGCYYTESNVIYINLKNHSSRKQLIDTIIHELIHKVSECKLPHGEMFDNMIKLISSLE